MKKKKTSTVVTLSELLEKVEQALYSSMPYSYWVSAEISELKTNAAGRC